MKMLPWRVFAAVLALSGASALAAQPIDNPLASFGGVGENPPVLELTQGGCGAAAQRAARQHGGQVVGAPRSDGRGNCIVTILVPGPPGQPPRRVQLTVPKG